VTQPPVQALGSSIKLSVREVRNLAVVVLIFLVVALVPLISSGYVLSISTSILFYTALATSWMLFSGPTNYISLATAAFFGIGMYVVAWGIDLMPYPLLIVLAALAGAALAVVVGLATLRVSGVYFVIFSLGLAELVRQIMTWLQHVLGTLSGLYVLVDRTEDEYYWQLLALTAFIFLIGWWIGRSRLGFALRIIGNDEVVAVHSGINTARAKVVGALAAPRWSYVEPTVAFSPFLSFQVVIMALLGGVHRLWGPLLGVIPFTLLWELISANFPAQTTLLLGATFLLIVYFIPNGIVGLLEDTLRQRHRLLQSAGGSSGLVKALLARWRSRNA
jgi:branched-chain amino acid transport system permease protein